MSDDLLRTALDAPLPQALAAARSLACLSAERLDPALAAPAGELACDVSSAQRRALLVCGVLGPLAADLVPRLLATLSSPRWPVREAALHALARIDAQHDAVRDAVAAAALDRSAPVRDAAVDLLARRPGVVPPTLAAALDHPLPRVRCRALLAAARLDPAGSVAALSAALTHSHQRVRRTAAELLGGLGMIALPAAGRLARCRCGADRAVAAAARRALSRLNLPPALAPLLGEASDPVELLAELLARQPEPLRRAAEATRAERLGRLRKPDPMAEAGWLIGWVVERAVGGA